MHGERAAIPHDASGDREIHGVAIVEDDPHLLARFARIVGHAPRLRLCSTAATLAEARRLLMTNPPDVLLTDLGLPDGDGIELVRELAPRGVSCMVVTVFGDEKHVVRALEAGALGYLLKDEVTERIPDAILDLVAGGSPISPGIARYLLRRFRSGLRSDDPVADEPARAFDASDPGLSPRETETLRYMVKGFTYAEAARLMQVSEHTVATYVRQIYKKLAVHSRGEAVYEALQLGLIRADD